VNGGARPFERCSKQSRRLATRAISANSQADFHQHVITQTVRGPCSLTKQCASRPITTWETDLYHTFVEAGLPEPAVRMELPLGKEPYLAQ
jgi:hypothetical protein